MRITNCFYKESLIILVLLVFCFCCVQAQDIQYKAWNATDNSYDAATDFPSNGVADDSAPRMRRGRAPRSNATQKMRAGPSKPTYRCRLQTTLSCCN